MHGPKGMSTHMLSLQGGAESRDEPSAQKAMLPQASPDADQLDHLSNIERSKSFFVF